MLHRALRLTLLSLLMIGGASMASAKSLVLASAVEGRLVTGADDSPVTDTRITRQWTWSLNGKTGEQATTTDAEGRFAFPEVTGRSLLNFMPHEPLIRSVISADLGGQEPLLLMSVQKGDYDADSELGRPLRILCRADKAPDGEGLFWGTCTEDK